MNIRKFDPPLLMRYAVAICSAAAASLATIGVASLLHGKAPLLFFTIAVLASAAYGGMGPGLLVTALSIAIVELFFHPEMFFLSIPHSNVALFAILGVGTSAVLGRLQTANAALKSAKTELESANQVLAHRTESLAQSNEELQRFAYALAHDLNTPLRGISALTQLLVERNPAGMDENSKECAGLIEIWDQ
jgi:K+-sensing histidine kinase KdpD